MHLCPSLTFNPFIVALCLKLSTRLSMAATAAGPRPPPAHPGPNGGNQFSGPNSGATNTGQQEPGLQCTSQDQGPSSHPQHYVPARPIFCIPAPPPPPFLPYQWPMPFSYNPFAGFPGMGYGMVMPQFPFPSYMEAPAYIVPAPHIQPVDYRRLLHPQMHSSSAPYQNPNHTRRVRLPLPVRESVNSAVQTETPQRGGGGYIDGSPPVRPDSGHGTASNSPSSSSSSTQKQGSAEVENVTSTRSGGVIRRNDKVKHGFNFPYPTETKTVHSRIRTSVETVGQHVHPYRNGHCNMWSVSSSDSMVPVCSSSQQDDEVVKERRVSFPDILMSWGGGTPQATMPKMADGVLQPNEGQLPSYETEIEHENSGYQGGTGNKNDPVALGSADAIDAGNISNSKDGETLFKILKLPFALELLSKSRRKDESVGLVGSERQSLPPSDEMMHSLKKSHELPDEQENVKTNPHEDTTDIIPYQMSLNSCQMDRQMNESVWSVESLAPFIPMKDLLPETGLFEPEMIIEETEEAENERLLSQIDNLTVKSDKERRQSRRFSSSDLELSWPFFSTPAEKRSPSKKAEMENETNASEPKHGHRVAPVEKCSFLHLTGLPCKVLLTTTEEDMDENRSSEPETNQSPNQQSVIVTEQQEKSPISSEMEEALLLSLAAKQKILATPQLILQNEVDKEVDDESSWSEEASQLRNKQLCVQLCVQVSDQHTEKVSPSKGRLLDCFTGCNEILCSQCGQDISKRLMGQSRRQPIRSSENQSNRQEAFHGNYVTSEKSKGGNGRNPHH